MKTQTKFAPWLRDILFKLSLRLIFFSSYAKKSKYFERPKSEGSEATVGEFYNRVDQLHDVLLDLDKEENQMDAELIEKYLNFITGLQDNLELLNDTQNSFDVSAVIQNMTVIDTVSFFFVDSRTIFRLF